MPQDESRQAGRALDWLDNGDMRVWIGNYAGRADAYTLPRRWLVVRVFPAGLREAVQQYAEEMSNQAKRYEVVDDEEMAAGADELAALLTDALEAMAEWRKVICPSCNGHGIVGSWCGGEDFLGARECEECWGSGFLYILPNDRVAIYPGGPWRGMWPGRYAEVAEKGG